jgi:hypothetical protein
MHDDEPWILTRIFLDWLQFFLSHKVGRGRTLLNLFLGANLLIRLVSS